MIERAVILSTGDEIMTGKVVDTNANYLACWRPRSILN